MKKRKMICPICGKTFMSTYKLLKCPQCRILKENSSEALNRPYTDSTVFLVNKWYSEGTSIERLCQLLHRSEENVIQALKIGYEGYENEYSPRMEVEI